MGCQCCVCIVKLCAQDLDQIGKGKPFTISGGASLNQVFYTSFGHDQRRDPYSYVASANLALSLYGWTVPLSFTFSNQGGYFQQPFNQYSAHPSYKAIHTHIGYVSASYSPYTVSGHNFLGAAVDYEPEGKIKCSALYGRFLKAVKYDSASANIPAYERMGYGAKVQFMHENNSVQVTLFHAEDKNENLLLPDTLTVNPQENLVLSLGASTILFSKFLLRGEVASSAISSDKNAPAESRDDFFSRWSPLYTTRVTTSFYNAWKANLDYQQQAFTIGLGYERVEPNYKTFGAYYFNNDLENITINASTALADGKLSVASSLGVQHDNLDKTKVSTLRRSVGSININFSPSEKLGFTGSYSSFQTFTNIQPQFQQLDQLSPYRNIDTLNFTQISHSGSLSANCALRSDDSKKQSINIIASVQAAADRQSDVVQNSGTVFYNVNGTYSVSGQSGTTFAVSFNGSLNRSEATESLIIGPMISISRAFFEKKLKANFSTNYLKTTDKETSSTIVTSRLGGSVKLVKRSNLNMNLSALHRQMQSKDNFFELTAMIGYSYSLGLIHKNEKRTL